MPELIVTCRELRYAGKPYLKGARFTATAKHAKILKAVKKAADAPAEPPAPVRQVATTRPLPRPEPVEVAPEPAPEPEAAAEPEAAPLRATRGTYRNRRMIAED